jgi:hypothetical protein
MRHPALPLVQVEVGAASAEGGPQIISVFFCERNTLYAKELHPPPTSISDAGAGFFPCIRMGRSYNKGGFASVLLQFLG